VRSRSAPLTKCDVLGKLEAFFATTKGRLSETDADALDSILQTAEPPMVVAPTFFLEVDRSRLADSVEAWLHVTIRASPNEHMIGFSRTAKASCRTSRH